ncbi:arylsulfatase [Reticulomyxa filosa]|uniref:Arylsulfatase n=1 Tax=Reticulomyxa filosa TaxID=46433 RepID=X6PGH7_RETFI|nr:arylsulfatase [Reticulomyxa filosa]|eukprot:ETO36792.1 arylsulfatase [Reticulomyxa filosa]
MNFLRSSCLLTFLAFVGHSLPNFLILFADDLGYGDLSYNGHPTISTPNVDQIAREGMILTQWYSGFHVCSPSRASLLTGRLPPRTGCAGPWVGGVFPSAAIGGLPHYEITFAQQLKGIGYKTKIIGKWHLGERQEFLPYNYGFDEFFGLPYSVNNATIATHLCGNQKHGNY